MRSPTPEALARLLLRPEAVASSRIEGLEVGDRRLLRTQAARQLGEEPRDFTAIEVLGNIEAMTWAVEALPPGGAISVEIVLEAHRRLLAGTRLAEHGGRTETVQTGSAAAATTRVQRPSFVGIVSILLCGAVWVELARVARGDPTLLLIYPWSWGVILVGMIGLMASSHILTVTTRLSE